MHKESIKLSPEDGLNVIHEFVEALSRGDRVYAGDHLLVAVTFDKGRLHGFIRDLFNLGKIVGAVGHIDYEGASEHNINPDVSFGLCFGIDITAMTIWSSDMKGGSTLLYSPISNGG